MLNCVNDSLIGDSRRVIKNAINQSLEVNKTNEAKSEKVRLAVNSAELNEVKVKTEEKIKEPVNVKKGLKI